MLAARADPASASAIHVKPTDHLIINTVASECAGGPFDGRLRVQIDSNELKKHRSPCPRGVAWYCNSCDGPRSISQGGNRGLGLAVSSGVARLPPWSGHEETGKIVAIIIASAFSSSYHRHAYLISCESSASGCVLHDSPCQ
jgi:hypothetical protein